MLKEYVKTITNNLRHKTSNPEILKNFMEVTAIDDYESAVDFLRTCGLPIAMQDNLLYLETSKKYVHDQMFCFVDIETNGPKANDHQVIEIAAICVKNFQIIKTMQTVVLCDNIPESIVEITGLNPQILSNGHEEAKALSEFKNMLKDAIFVAHNVGFDFGFISKRMEKLGVGLIFNRRLCTVELAKRTLNAPKYGLKSLSEIFELPKLGSHRALPDAIASKDIFELALKAMNKDDISVEELISFSEQAPSMLQIQNQRGANE